MVAVPSGSAAHQHLLVLAATRSYSQLLAATATASAIGARHRLWSLNRGAKAGETLSCGELYSTLLSSINTEAASRCVLYRLRDAAPGAPFCAVGVRSNPEAPAALPCEQRGRHLLAGSCWRTGNPESLRIVAAAATTDVCQIASSGAIDAERWSRPARDAWLGHPFACRRACAAAARSRQQKERGPGHCCSIMLGSGTYEVQAVFPRTRPSFESAFRLPRSEQQLAVLYLPTCTWTGRRDTGPGPGQRAGRGDKAAGLIPVHRSPYELFHLYGGSLARL
jgi:hypothetical protein